MTRRVVAALVCFLLPTPVAAQAPGGAAQAPETYESAAVGTDGSLVITTSRGRRIVVAREGEQSSFSEPIVSMDRQAVGAQAYFPNCCTSYDIPLALVVYRQGKVHRFRGAELPIFEWHFSDTGTRVAFGQEPVHFGCTVHYELRDIDSERVIDSADIPRPCGQNPNPGPVSMPTWVSALRATK